MATSAGPLRPPGDDGPPPQGAGPGPGGPGAISPEGAQPDPNAGALIFIQGIIQNARRIGLKYPAAQSEVREIMNSVQRMQQKIVQSGPSPEPASPPV